MKTRNKSLLFVLAAVCGMALSCTDGYESLPVNQFTDEYLFSTTDSAGKVAQEFLNAIYEKLPSGYNRVGNDFLDAASDDAISIAFDSDPDVRRLQTGSYTASNMVSSDMNWDKWYQCIRQCNIFLGGIDRVPYNTYYTNALGQQRPWGVSFKAEARFLRAFFYFQLLERYGGVPIVGDKVFDIEDDLELPRNTFQQTVDYIMSELNEIRDSLRAYPLNDAGTFAHVPTKQACMALQSRLLLYAASPLFNERPLQPGNELVGYASYDPERWRAAADTAKKFIDDYGVITLRKSLSTSKFHMTDKGSFVNSFINFYGTENHEIIFFRNNGSGHSVESKNGPLGFSGNKLGNGRTNPTQDLVDAFPMLDGKPRGESAYPYDPQKPYENRDPRLDYTVLHQGSRWFDTELQTYQGGIHNPASASGSSQTSYYMRKFMGDNTLSSEYGDHYELWIFFRFGEILLNYAEAANECDDAYRAEHMNDIINCLACLRWRAGIEAGSDKLYGLSKDMTRDELRAVIHNERRIEMAFEEQRYFDIRRWREAEVIFQKPLQGMQIIQGTEAMYYQPFDLLKVDWADRMYLYPIPYTEVNKNKNMVQNPFWEIAEH